METVQIVECNGIPTAEIRYQPEYQEDETPAEVWPDLPEIPLEF